jgi:hypothetical protein
MIGVNEYHHGLLFPATVSLLAVYLCGCRADVVNTNDGGNNNTAVNQQVTGGPCEYRHYPGAVTVREVRASSWGDEVVTVEFDADGYAPEKRFSQDVTLPRERAEKKGLAVGKKFRAEARFIEHGACNPGPYLSEPEERR